MSHPIFQLALHYNHRVIQEVIRLLIRDHFMAMSQIPQLIPVFIFLFFLYLLAPV